MAYCVALPSRVGVAKLPIMRSRWDGPLGDAVRQLMPRVFPGAPVEMGIGITANSMGATEVVRTANFWEIGWYNIPAGPLDRPPPGGMYLSVAQGDTVRALIGRSADVSSSWASDTLGQAAVGLVAYADVESRNVIDRIPEDLRPQEGGSVWKVACSIMGYVSGGPAASAIHRHAAILRQTNERDRFYALAREVAREAERGEDVSGPAYPIARAMQRLACGKAIAATRGSSTSWWASPADEPVIEHWITISKYGQPEYPDCVPVNVRMDGMTLLSSPPLTSVLIPVGVGILVLGGLGWLAWRKGLFGSPGSMVS